MCINVLSLIFAGDAKSEKLKITILTVTFGLAIISFFNYSLSQHNNEFYNDGALVHVQAGAEVHVWGDVHMAGATAELQNNGLIKTQGNSYSDNLFQQSGTGTYRVENSDVNTGERQFIEGSYAVRGGTGQIGVDDGSFYDLELANDQSIVYLVGSGNVADVRNSVNYQAGATMNRIITHDVGLTGVITPPANGSGYASVFGLMNSTAGLANLLNNTVTVSGNMSGVDQGYVQGKFRRAIDPAGGVYGFVMGVEPDLPFEQRGMQYIHLDFAANNYDVISGYFESASPNTGTAGFECSGETVDYFGGVAHGEWFFTDITGTGTGTYAVQVWPQDDNLPFLTTWLITKDNSFQGTANECGPSPVGLTRSGFNGFSEFGVAGVTSALPIEFLNINAQGIDDHIVVTWNVASELNLSHYELERSEDAITFEHISDHAAVGTTQAPQTYSYDDYDVRYFQNYYYRVKSVDNDGSYEYTPIVSASIQNGSGMFDENSVYLFPNPSSDDFMLLLHSDQDMNVTMEVSNSLGQIVMGRDLNALTGSTTFGIKSKDWRPGVYYVQLKESATGTVVNKRFVKY